MPEIEEIRRRWEAAQAMGGPQKVARQQALGRLTVRERIGRLADRGGTHRSMAARRDTGLRLGRRPGEGRGAAG